MLERKPLKLVGSYSEPSFFLTPEMNFEGSGRSELGIKAHDEMLNPISQDLMSK